MLHNIIKIIITLNVLFSSIIAIADNGSMIITVTNNTNTACTLISLKESIPKHGYVSASSQIPFSIAPNSSAEFTLLKRTLCCSEVYLGYNCAGSIASFSTWHHRMSTAITAEKIAISKDKLCVTAAVTTTDRKDRPARVNWLISST